MADLFGEVLRIPFSHGEKDLWVFQLPDGSKVEVFGSHSDNPHFATGPYPDSSLTMSMPLRKCFARRASQSSPIRWEGEDDVAWVHFRAPDGNIYELTQGRDLER